MSFDLHITFFPFHPPLSSLLFPSLLSSISLGEGWHNWHHAYPWDYAASESNLNVFARYNIARMWIDFYASLGGVWDRKIQRKHVPLVKYADGEAPYC